MARFGRGAFAEAVQPGRRFAAGGEAVGTRTKPITARTYRAEA